MSLRQEARDFADDVAERVISGLFGLIERRIAWRRAHPHRIALEHQRYAQLLREHRPGRRWAIRRHENAALRWGARAWALDAELAVRMECPLCLAA